MFCNVILLNFLLKGTNTKITIKFNVFQAHPFFLNSTKLIGEQTNNAKKQP